MVERPSPRAPAPSSARALVAAVLGALSVAIGAPSCLDTRRSSSTGSEERRCASCHGDAQRAGDYLRRAAPPFDSSGRSSTHNPGVGAHDFHLEASPTHAAVACQECHVVPDSVGAAGHDDDARPAELRFGKLARHADHAPSYDPRTRSCSQSYCHGQAEPRWTEPRDSDAACGSCHGLPPPAPHPQSERCSACHGDVVDAERHFLDASLHVDGKVQYTAGSCESCHGSPDSPAPPRDLAGHSELTSLGVGAHQAHLSGGSAGRPLQCSECHRVPDRVEEPTHADAPPAEVTLLGVARAHGHAPRWDRGTASCTDTYCHAPSPGDQQPSPIWNAERDSSCQSCHGTPPPAPHPQIAACSRCHAPVVGADDRTILDRLRHVDGKVDLSFDASCSSCHGDAVSPAPPRDASGNVSVSSAGVGAHRAHVLGSDRARAVPCETCHLVPEGALDPAHIDSPLPAEVVFSGAALNGGARPRYVAGSCRDTSCHGALLPDRYPSGGTNTTPIWTGGPDQAACGSCHGLPPPPPHPLATYPCHACHGDISDDDTTFTHPEQHVDGSVTFLPP